MVKGANVALANNEGELPLDLAEEEDVKHYLETVIEMQGEMVLLLVGLCAFVRGYVVK